MHSFKIKGLCTCGSQSNIKIAISHMFSTKLKIAADCLLNWFNRKFKNKNLELSNEQKIQYDTSNSMNWQDSRCFICNYLLEIRVKRYEVEEREMSRMDFLH